MTNSQLDHLPIITRDPGLVGASLDRLADQLRDGWRQARTVRLPSHYRNINRIAVCGMGGSHLGADILKSALADRLAVPVSMIADYSLPAWVNRQTLVIGSSYSGTTEETIASLAASQRRHAKIMVITSGPALASRAKNSNWPVYHFKPTANPSGQPRMGIAYGMMSLLSSWRKLGLVKVSDPEIQSLPVSAWEAVKKYSARRPSAINTAKQIASRWDKSIPLLIGAEWAAGNILTMANQIHENAKTFAAGYLLPDLNHHLLEGLRNKSITRQISVLMVDDRDYHPRTHRRLLLTANILKKSGAAIDTYRPRGTGALSKAIDLLAFGGYVSWYLAAVRRVNPADIPTVDFLKRELAKR